MLKMVVVGVVAAVIGVGIYVVSSDQDSQAPVFTPTPASSSSDTVSPASTGRYIDYYDGVIGATSGTKIIFFHAPWCPQCRALEASIKDGQIPAGVTIIKTDYDSMQSLRQKYGVTIQTTLVKVDDGGNLIKKYVAYDEPTLDNLIANLL